MTAPTLLRDVRITPDAAMTKFGDAQGNILKAHGRRHATLLFLEFSDPAGARQLIGQLLTGLSTGPRADTDTVRITSAKKQLEDSQAFRDSQGQKDAGLFTSLLMTAAGLSYLQVPAARFPQEEADQAPSPIPGLGRADAFAHGMRHATTRALLADHQAGWAPGWWDADGQPAPIHALLLLADDDLPHRLQPAVNFMKERAQSLGAAVRVEQAGERLLDEETQTHDIEHFGYADGVSQPLFLTSDNPLAAPHVRDLALRPEELVFVPDHLSPTPDTAWGSFLVFRKLQQQVAAFNEDEDVKLVAALGLPQPDEEATKAFAGAMVVGRFENGTPLKLSGTDVDSQAGKPLFTNDFDYEDDLQGMRCPFHAHIRKMNPRGQTPDPAELKRRITRRGIPYGQRGIDVPDAEKGLLFMCYQRNIGQQFEFMQAGWANNPDFIHGADAAAGLAAVGLDPVIGQPDLLGHNSLAFPTEWHAHDDKAPVKTAPFGQYVNLQGGEYFYAPSMSGLAALAGTETAA